MLEPFSEPKLEAHQFAFGPFQVDVRSGEVRKHGYKVKLQDQPFRVLEILLRRPGELVTREELQRQVWPADTFVDFDRGLNNAIKRLRDALGDSADDPQFVETVARHGYRFVGLVTESPQNGSALSSATPVVTQDVRSQDLPLIPLAKNWGWIMAIAAFAAITVALQFRRPGRLELKSASELRTQRMVAQSSESRIGYAAISPDGRNIAYVDPAGIHVRVVETGETRTILPPVEPTTNTPTTERVSAAASFPISWYPDGTTLLVSTGVPRSQDHLPVMWAISLLTGNMLRLYEGAWGSSVSPDGTTVAAVKDEREIWFMGPHGESPHRFTSVPAGNEIGRVIWSPDSRRVLYFHVFDREGRLECALENSAVDNERPVVLISDTRLCYSQAQSSSWLPDGRVMFPFSEPNFNYRNFNLWGVSVDLLTGKPTARPERLTDWPGSYLQGISATVDGRRVEFLRTWFRTETTVGEIDPYHFGSITDTRPLASDADEDWPTAWTDDSRAVVFYSVKNGDTDVFEQPLDQESSKPLVTGPGEQLAAVAAPDGRSFIYMSVPRFQTYGLPNPVELMKVPQSGGTPTLVLRSDAYDSHSCARAPSTLCIISERTGDSHIVLSSFDPANDGASVRGPKLATIEYGSLWAVSPDGSMLATVKPEDSRLQIKFVSLGGAAPSELSLPAWNHADSMHWAADGRSLFIATRAPEGCTLLQVDLRGTTRVVSRAPGAFQMWGIPSPDGHHLAVFTAMATSEIWIAENF